MKRLQPLSLTVYGPNEVRLLCRPKVDQLLSEEAVADLMVSIRARAVNQPTDAFAIEAEFPFTFAENGSVHQDRQFQYLTGDDYGDLWMSQAAEYLSMANERGVLLDDHPDHKAFAIKLLVDPRNDQETRRYTVVFSPDDTAFESIIFTVVGKGSKRDIACKYGSYSMTWEKRKWKCDSTVPADFELLLLLVMRMDEAINIELMPYAVNQ